MTAYIFDVDGTLTPSRAKIRYPFAAWLEHFLTHNECYLVTGSDREKTLEQIPPTLYYLFQICYQCSGNDEWSLDRRVYSKPFEPSAELLEMLESEVKQSRFYRKNGYHIDVRQGLVNFSIPGRGIDIETRAMYKQWDEHKEERKAIAERLRIAFPELNITVAGETGIDIQQSSKAQILDRGPLLTRSDIIFFGDKCQPGGNDYELAEAVRESGGTVIEVNSWEDTWNALKQLA